MVLSYASFSLLWQPTVSLLLQVGMTVHCRIMKIDIEKFSVDLTCRTSDLMDKANEWKLPKDSYYDFDTESEDQKQEEELKKKQQRTRKLNVTIDQTRWDQNCLLMRRASFPQCTLFTHQYLLPHPFSLSCVFFCLSSVYQACDRPPQLSQYQFQPGREDDGDPGSGRLDHPTQQQGRESPHRHLESKKQGSSWARNS